MTRDEAWELLLNNQVRRVAKVVDAVLCDLLDNEIFLRESVQFAVGGVAREILGRDRPLNDDDRVYFEFCDRLGDLVRRRIEAAISDEIRRI
jgi:hypothetical protein